MEICKKCSSEKQFIPDKKRKSGYRTVCLRCLRAYQKSYRANNKNKIAANKRQCYFNRKLYYDTANKTNRERGPKSFLVSLYYQIKRHANIRSYSVNRLASRDIVYRKPIDVDIDCGFLFELHTKQNGKCAISGVYMSHQAGSLSTISIDRINSDEGYVPGNVQLVCQFVNLGKHTKSNQSACEFIRMLYNAQV